MRAPSRILALAVALVPALLPASCGGGGGRAATPGPSAPPSTGALRVDDGSARAAFEHLRLAFDDAGRGVAVWEERTGIASRVLWAWFDGSTWRPESELALYASSPAVATNGTDFLLVWIGDRIQAAPVSGGGALGAPVPLSEPSVNEPDVASNGSGYAASWTGYDAGSGGQRVFASVYDAGSWGPAQQVSTVPGAENGARIASDGTGYAVCWRNDAGAGYDAWAALSSDGSATATWQTPALLESGPGPVDALAIASNGSGYGVVWAQDDAGTYAVYANRYDGGWQGAGTLLSSDRLYDGVPSLASNGATYAAVWSQRDAATGYRVHARIHDGSGWSAAQLLDTSPGTAGSTTVASDGAGYAAAWEQGDGAGGEGVQACRYVSGDWSAPVALDVGTGGARDPLAVRRPDGYAVAWHQQDASGNPNLFAAFHASGAWSPGEPLVQDVWGSACLLPRLATNANGVSLAVWAEYHAGAWRVVGSLNGTGTWGAPFVLDADATHQVAVATNGTSFMVLWYSRTLFAPVAAVCSQTGTVDPPQPVGPPSESPAYDPGLASNGSGYAALWSGYEGGYLSIFSNVFEAGAWETDGAGDPAPWRLESQDGQAYLPRIVSDGTGYAAAWVQQSGASSRAYASVFAGGAWPSDGTVLDAGGFAVRQVDLASNGSGYAAVWDQGNGVGYDVHARLYESGAWASGDTLLEAGTPTAYAPAIASNGSGYAVAWSALEGSTFDIRAKIFAAGAWSPEAAALETLDEYAYGPSVGSDGSGYAVSWVQDHDGFASAYVNVYAGGAWATGGTLLEQGGGDVQTTSIVSNGNRYSVIWWQQDPSDELIFDVWAVLGI